MTPAESIWPPSSGSPGNAEFSVNVGQPVLTVMDASVQPTSLCAAFEVRTSKFLGSNVAGHCLFHESRLAQSPVMKMSVWTSPRAAILQSGRTFSL